MDCVGWVKNLLWLVVMMRGKCGVVLRVRVIRYIVRVLVGCVFSCLF